MKRLFPLLCMIFLSVNMVTLALILEKAPYCRLQSITQTSSLGSSLKKLDFSYDLSNRLTEEIVTSVNSEYPNSSYYNYTLKINYEYSEDKLTMLLKGNEYSTYTLENGNIHLKELEYEKVRLTAVRYSHPISMQQLHDEVDKVLFNWEGDDVIAISFNKGSTKDSNKKCNNLIPLPHGEGRTKKS